MKVEDLPLRDEGDKRSLLLMLDHQVNYLESIPNRSFRLGGITVSRERLLATAKALRLVVLEYHGRPEFGLRVREKFDIYQTSNPSKEGKALFTGYFDPVIDVSPTPTARFRFPIYRKPDDLKHGGGDRFFRVVGGSMTPYFTREEIDGSGVLQGKGYEIAWSDDYVSVYYLMIQGSGRLHFPDGRVLTLHFAASNGHPFGSAARACMQDGQCPGGYDSNLAWFRKNSASAKKYFFKNPRYIFFSLDQEAPRGVANIPLTAYRTIATDKTQYPPGAIAFVKLPMPNVDADGKVTIRSTSLFVADGDTGAAIKGSGRADFYYGVGAQAEARAGKTYGWGEMYYLLVK